MIGGSRCGGGDGQVGEWGRDRSWLMISGDRWGGNDGQMEPSRQRECKDEQRERKTRWTGECVRGVH